MLKTLTVQCNAYLRVLGDMPINTRNACEVYITSRARYHKGVHLSGDVYVLPYSI